MREEKIKDKVKKLPVELPASITDLDTGLAKVNGDDFAHVEFIKIKSLLVMKNA